MVAWANIRPEESHMTEPMIDPTEAEAEEFTDELSDEALDREGAFACGGGCGRRCHVGS